MATHLQQAAINFNDNQCLSEFMHLQDKRQNANKVVLQLLKIHFKHVKINGYYSFEVFTGHAITSK